MTARWQASKQTPTICLRACPAWPSLSPVSAASSAAPLAHSSSLKKAIASSVVSIIVNGSGSRQSVISFPRSAWSFHRWAAASTMPRRTASRVAGATTEPRKTPAIVLIVPCSRGPSRSARTVAARRVYSTRSAESQPGT